MFFFPTKIAKMMVLRFSNVSNLPTSLKTNQMHPNYLNVQKDSKMSL